MLDATDLYAFIALWAVFTFGMTLIWWLRHRPRPEDEDQEGFRHPTSRCRAPQVQMSAESEAPEATGPFSGAIAGTASTLGCLMAARSCPA
jgi:hypothetical protein